jgi:hypothetical protein
MSRVVRSSAVALLMAFVARASDAQSPADSIFGTPRWAIEAPVGAGYAALLLRFGTSASAWVVGVHWNGGLQSGTMVSPSGSTDEDASFYDVNLSIGRRSYRGAGTVRPFLGFGLTASLGGRDDDSVDESRWSAGAYGEMGAAYFVNRHLSLGGLGSVSLSRSEQTVEQSFSGQVSRLERRLWIFDGPNLRLIVSVYF